MMGRSRSDARAQMCGHKWGLGGTSDVGVVFVLRLQLFYMGPMDLAGTEAKSLSQKHVGFSHS